MESMMILQYFNPGVSEAHNVRSLPLRKMRYLNLIAQGTWGRYNINGLYFVDNNCLIIYDSNMTIFQKA